LLFPITNLGRRGGTWDLPTVRSKLSAQLDSGRLSFDDDRG
jgi:hypothetical protein